MPNLSEICGKSPAAQRAAGDSAFQGGFMLPRAEIYAVVVSSSVIKLPLLPHPSGGSRT